MSYRPVFDCLWCGTAWTTRGPDDLEGWALLCPECLGRAGSNPFLHGRLRAGIAERGAGGGASAARATATASTRASVPAYPAFPDDWFLRRGAFERGALHDAAWAAELDMVTRWLDGLPLRGRIVEPAAGVGFFSPLLAEKGELSAYDADGAALDRARERLVAHRLRAHIHVADPFARPLVGAPGPNPDRGAGVDPDSGADPDSDLGADPHSDPGADAVVAAFLLGRVRGAGLDLAVDSLRARLAPGGRLALIELRPDPAGGPPPGVAWTWHDPALVEAALGRAGFATIELTSTGRFFLEASAVAR